MKKRAAMVLSLMAGSALAGTPGDVSVPSAWRWVGSVSAGSAWSAPGETQQFYLAPLLEKAYVANKSAKAFFTGELFAGIQKALSPHWVGQLGLAFAATGGSKLQGIIWDDADAAFANHSYRYKVRSMRVTAKGKLLFDKGQKLVPWISGGLGIGFNRSYDYSNTPLITQALPNANFSSNTKTAFTYTLSAGVQTALNTHWHMGLGYEFADWGKSSLGRAAGQSLNSGLSLNHLYSHSALLTFTYTA